jgi:hypothetical protein
MGDSRVVIEGYLPPSAVVDMMIERQVAGVELSTPIPSIPPVVVLAENLAGLFEPVDEIHLLAPEELRILDRECVYVPIPHGIPTLRTSTWIEASYHRRFVYQDRWRSVWAPTVEFERIPALLHGCYDLSSAIARTP